MKKRIWIPLLIVGILLIAGIAKRELVRILMSNVFSEGVKMDTSTVWEGGDSYIRLPYSDISENTYMNLYIPDSEEPMPLFVLIHGGGFVFNDCESRQAQLMYRYFRDHGYACASINYRLAQEAPFPGAVEDVKAATRFLKANAETYGYDAERIAVWGESAGGYLSVMAGFTTDEDFHSVPFIGEDELAVAVTADVPVVVDFYGAVQMEKSEEDFDTLKVPKIVRWAAGLWLQKALKGTGYGDVKSYWLRKDIKELTEAEWNSYDPYYYMSKNIKPENARRMIIWHGDADLDVPYLQSERLSEELGAVIGEDNVTYELFHNQKHASDAFYSDENLARLKTLLDQAFEAGIPAA